MIENILEFNKVSYRYQNQKISALRELSLGIPAGSVTAILGPNGAGKTTLLHLAMGWLKGQSGTISLSGRPLGAYVRRELGQIIALVPQSEHIAFEYSLLEYVLLGRAPYLTPLDLPGQDDCRIAAESLFRVGMGDLNQRSITNLSGGERQMALIARALAQQPRLMLLDEPTSHLDLGNKIRLLKLIKELLHHGVTILLTTHEPDVATAIATHLVLVRAGQVQHSGTLEEVFTGDRLSETYGTPVRVLELEGQRHVLWHDGIR
jgi:iron complex transport system ATP-binding protein